MDKSTTKDLDAAFSLLPADKAIEAREQLLQAYASGGQAQPLTLKWTEHDAGGAFLRGGVSDMIDRSTRLVANTQLDRDIYELARLAQHGIAQAGAVELLPQMDRFAWYLPFSASKPDEHRPLRLRGLMVTQPLFNEVLDLFNPGAGLTSAECRVLFQVVAGITPRDASALDGVSFETKRAHIKSASAKLQCAGQKDLVRKVMGQLVHLLSVSEGEAAHADIAETFVARHLADDVELSVERLPNGRILRVFECGPAGGRPIIMIHGMMFPISLAGISRHLDAAGLRLIVPIRPGFLESRPDAGLAGHGGLISQAMVDLAQYLELRQSAPTVIFGLSLGAALAIRFANLQPDLVSQVVLTSTNLMRNDQTGENHASTFYGGLKRLSRNPQIFRLVNWQFRKYYADRRIGRAILSRLFAQSDIDMDVLDGTATGVKAYGMFSDLYGSSILGITEDFDFVAMSWKDEVRKIDKPITFIHGCDDPLTSVAEFEPLVTENRKHRIVALPGGGHFIAASHPSQVWNAVADCLL